MNDYSIRYTVIGAGHGGKAMAAHLALMGFEVTLFNRTPEHVDAIKARGGITLMSQESGLRGFGKLTKVTSNMQEALDDNQVIMVVVPASAHRDIACSVAPYLRDGQIVILNPGRTLGALEFRNVLRNQGCTANVLVAEAQTFIYASRSDGPAQARIFRIKDAVPLAALPSSDTSEVLEYINLAYPQFIDGGNVMHTSMNNIGAIFHPAITLLNAGWIEASGGEFQFYLDGVTPTVARIMEAIDRERINVASALGIQATTAREWLKIAYNTSGMNLHEAIHNQLGYRGIGAPPTLTHRYITEDIPMSLIPLAALGQRYGVSVRGMESIIRLACIAHQVDYWQYGRTLEKLGIDHLSTAELLNYVKDGLNEKKKTREVALYRRDGRLTSTGFQMASGS
jgi:opine dehydrogenase